MASECESVRRNALVTDKRAIYTEKPAHLQFFEYTL